MYSDITPQEAVEWAAKGAQLVDVREPWEFEGGHIAGSLNIPIGDFIERLSELRSPVVLICASGSRSAAAADYLARNEFGEVANLAGGVHGWAAAGLEFSEE